MTAIKQKGVTSKSHGKNLRKYIDNKDALLRDTQHIFDYKNWYSEMEDTRHDFGHNKARKNSLNTIIYHQMLNFLPDECDVNGGRLSPESCMDYAKEYAQTYYPDHQIAFALHKEHCKADNTFRYSVHMAINRTNITTGNRLAEGRGDAAKKKRAGQVRSMDDKLGLAALEKGVRNSIIHDRQPDRIEREISERNGFSYKANLRSLIVLAKEESTSLDMWIDKLKEWGVETSLYNGKIYVMDVDNDKYSFRADRLNYDFTKHILTDDIASDDHKVLAMAKQMKREIGMNRYENSVAEKMQLEYQREIEKRFSDYKKVAVTAEGTDYKDFPKFIIPDRTSVHDTLELNLLTVSLRQKAEELRLKHSKNAPITVNKGSITQREISYKNDSRNRDHDNNRNNKDIKR